MGQRRPVPLLPLEGRAQGDLDAAARDRARRLARAERIGLSYEEYTLEILERGRYLQPENAEEIAAIKRRREP